MWSSMGPFLFKKAKKLADNDPLPPNASLTFEEFKSINNGFEETQDTEGAVICPHGCYIWNVIFNGILRGRAGGGGGVAGGGGGVAGGGGVR